MRRDGLTAGDRQLPSRGRFEDGPSERATSGAALRRSGGGGDRRGLSGALGSEYADLCRTVVGKLGRKRPSPLTRGDPRIWAAGVVYAVGQLNFLFDPAQSPHATTDQLSEWLGVKKTAMANKARLIRDTLKLSHFDGQFIRRDLVEASPLTWLLQVDGLLVDIRQAPRHLQVQAFESGLIPYVPGVGDDRT